MKISIKKIISPNMPFSILLILATILIWLVAYRFKVAEANPGIESDISETVLRIFHSKFILSLSSLLITLFNAFLIVQINNRFTIIRTRSFIPVFIFLTMMSVVTNVHQLPGSHFALTFLLAALFVFFDMFRNRQASEQAFLGSLLVSTGSLFITPVVLFLPVCWIGFAQFKSLSLRTFLASIIGGLVPWIFYFSIKFYFETDYQWFESLISNFHIGFNLLDLPLIELIYLASMSVYIIAGLVGLFSNLHGDSLQSRAYLNFLVMLLMFSFLFSVLFVNEYLAFIPFVVMLFSFLLAHPFTLKPNGFYAIIFHLLVITNITYLIFSLI